MSLKTIIRRKLYDLFNEPRENYAAVFDSEFRELLNTFIMRHDPELQNVVVTQMLGKLHTDQKLDSVMYIIYPTKENIDLILTDIWSQKQYTKFYVRFATLASQQQLQDVKDAVKATSRVVDIKNNVLAFSLSDTRTVVTHAHEQAFNALRSDTWREWVSSIMDSVASLLETLQDQPRIRYGALHGMQEVTQVAAEMLQRRLQDCKLPKVYRPEGTADLLILHRGFDLVGALAHDPTYSALLQDLHPVRKDWKPRGVDEAPEGQDPRPKREALEGPQGQSIAAVPEEQMDRETHPLWEEIRHLAPLEVNGYLLDIENEADAALQQVKKTERGKDGLKAFELGMRMQQARVYNLALAERWKAGYIPAMNRVMDLERLVASGQLRDAEDELGKVLVKDGHLMRPEDIERLLAICMICTGRQPNVQRLLQMANGRLSQGHLQAALRFVQELQGFVPWTQSWWATLRGLQWPAQQRSAEKPPEPRFSGLLAGVLRAIATEQVPPGLFEELPRGDQEHLRSNLRIGFDWARRTITDGPDLSVNTRRIIVVILGGMTEGESRVVNQLSSELRRNIVLVSTSLQHPNTLLHDVLNTPVRPPTPPATYVPNPASIAPAPSPAPAAAVASQPRSGWAVRTNAATDPYRNTPSPPPPTEPYTQPPATSLPPADSYLNPYNRCTPYDIPAYAPAASPDLVSTLPKAAPPSDLPRQRSRHQRFVSEPPQFTPDALNPPPNPYHPAPLQRYSPQPAPSDYKPFNQPPPTHLQNPPVTSPVTSNMNPHSTTPPIRTARTLPRSMANHSRNPSTPPALSPPTTPPAYHPQGPHQFTSNMGYTHRAQEQLQRVTLQQAGQNSYRYHSPQPQRPSSAQPPSPQYDTPPPAGTDKASAGVGTWLKKWRS